MKILLDAEQVRAEVCKSYGIDSLKIEVSSEHSSAYMTWKRGKQTFRFREPLDNHEELETKGCFPFEYPEWILNHQSLEEKLLKVLRGWKAKAEGGKDE